MFFELSSFVHSSISFSVELVSEVIKAFALSVRLAAYIIVGHFSVLNVLHASLIYTCVCVCVLRAEIEFVVVDDEPCHGVRRHWAEANSTNLIGIIAATIGETHTTNVE